MTSSGEVPTRLLYLANLSRWERARIASDPELTAAIRAAAPSAWRATLEAHDQATRALASPRHAAASAPMHLQALHDLEAERQALASLTNGRRAAVFRAAARLARYAANNVLPAAEIKAGLLEAWHASGAGTKHGDNYARSAIRRALDRGRNDPLPPLARRFREQNGRDGR